jgi:ubiquinone/menaquinone biosynthesis C-methylase UbiE
VFDIGAGDGNFIIRCAQTTQAEVVGVEIDEERAANAVLTIQQEGVERCRMVCGNALEHDYSSGNAFFLYLVPRGLRIILPQLKALGRVRVVTYMAPFPEEQPVRVVKVGTASHPEAQWPLYYYELNA